MCESLGGMWEGGCGKVCGVWEGVWGVGREGVGRCVGCGVWRVREGWVEHRKSVFGRVCGCGKGGLHGKVCGVYGGEGFERVCGI